MHSRLWSMISRSRRSSRPVLLLSCVVLAVTAASCQRTPARLGESEAPAVPVAHALAQEVTDYVDFTGRTEAVDSVNIVARVTGYLVQMPFVEGSDVKAGELLFVIDPRPYQAQYEQQVSQVSLSQAQLELAQRTFERFEALKKETPGAVSAQALDQYRASVQEAQARVAASRKSLEVYQLNKEFTHVVSPINGQVSRKYLTLGNLVNQDQTLLTTVVSLDPMYVYFDMDERTLLRIRRLINEGKIKPRAQRTGRLQVLSQLLAAQAIAAPSSLGSHLIPTTIATAIAVWQPDLPVFIGLQGEDGFPHQGFINFANNQVNPNTGSISVRGIFSNPKPPNGVRLASPGMFARIRLPIGQPHPALLVIDRAIQSDQGKKYVYVVDADNKVQQRPVTTGALQGNGLRVISNGVQPGDWVVVGNLQQVRPGMEVRPDERPRMPSFSDEAPPQTTADGNSK